MRRLEVTYIVLDIFWIVCCIFAIVFWIFNLRVLLTVYLYAMWISLIAKSIVRIILLMKRGY